MSVKLYDVPRTCYIKLFKKRALDYQMNSIAVIIPIIIIIIIINSITTVYIIYFITFAMTSLFNQHKVADQLLKTMKLNTVCTYKWL